VCRFDLNFNSQHSTAMVDAWDYYTPRRESYWAEAAAAALAVGTQAAAATSAAMKLQSFSLMGYTASAAVLQQLLPEHLTRLSVEVQQNNSANMQAVAALSRLHTLHLRTLADSLSARADVLKPLTCLQQLRQLQVGHVEPRRLWCLQPLLPQLQQLQIAVRIGENAVALPYLTKWLQHNAKAVSSIEIADGPPVDHGRANELVAALEAAAPALPPTAVLTAGTAAARTAAPAAAATVPGLQSFVSRGRFPEPVLAPLLQVLPAASLTQLQCRFSWPDSAQVNALCRLTQLRSCTLQGPYQAHVSVGRWH
jgi:hypothetical protein